MNLVFTFSRHDSCSLCLLNFIKKDFYGGKRPVYLPVTLFHDHMVMAGGAGRANNSNKDKSLQFNFFKLGPDLLSVRNCAVFAVKSSAASFYFGLYSL